MQIESTRFGTLAIREDAVVEFPEGLIGLEGRRYALIAQSEDSPFYWLHAVDSPDVAVPVTSPWLFFGDYEVRISDDEIRRLDLDGPQDAEIFCVVRAAPVLAEFTINLVSPIVIHAVKRIGRQVINETGGYRVRQPLFSEVELEHVSSPSIGVPVAAMA